MNEISAHFARVRQNLRRFRVWILTKLAHWLGPRLDPYRPSRQAQIATALQPEAPQPHNAQAGNFHAADFGHQLAAPQTLAEFSELLYNTPADILSPRDRQVIASVMKFPEVRVSELMLPAGVIVYVHANETLGPLTLDRLYRSGFEHFPVIDQRGQIIGAVHTAALNNLEVRQTLRAEEILDPRVYYLREDYTLTMALAAFLRTNCYFFLVVNQFGQVVGLLTFQALLEFLFGRSLGDDFRYDGDKMAVAKRQS